MSADEEVRMPRREAVVVVVAQRGLMDTPEGRQEVEALAREKADVFLASAGYTYADPGAPFVFTQHEDSPWTPVEHRIPADCILVRTTFDTVQLPTTP